MLDHLHLAGAARNAIDAARALTTWHVEVAIETQRGVVMLAEQTTQQGLSGALGGRWPPGPCTQPGPDARAKVWTHRDPCRYSEGRDHRRDQYDEQQDDIRAGHARS